MELVFKKVRLEEAIGALLGESSHLIYCTYKTGSGGIGNGLRKAESMEWILGGRSSKGSMGKYVHDYDFYKLVEEESDSSTTSNTGEEGIYLQELGDYQEAFDEYVDELEDNGDVMVGLLNKGVEGIFVEPTELDDLSASYKDYLLYMDALEEGGYLDTLEEPIGETDASYVGEDLGEEAKRKELEEQLRLLAETIGYTLSNMPMVKMVQSNLVPKEELIEYRKWAEKRIEDYLDNKGE